MKESFFDAIESTKKNLKNLTPLRLFFSVLSIWLFPLITYVFFHLFSQGTYELNLEIVFSTYMKYWYYIIPAPLLFIISLFFVIFLSDLFFNESNHEDELIKEVKLKSSWFLSTYLLFLLILATKTTSDSPLTFIYENKINFAILGLVIEKVAQRIYLNRMLK